MSNFDSVTKPSTCSGIFTRESRFKISKACEYTAYIIGTLAFAALTIGCIFFGVDAIPLTVIIEFFKVGGGLALTGVIIAGLGACTLSKKTTR